MFSLSSLQFGLKNKPFKMFDRYLGTYRYIDRHTDEMPDARPKTDTSLRSVNQPGFFSFQLHRQ